MQENNKRIAKNTLMLYFRQILILFVSFYTVRVVLNVLGIEDYGIYNVVGGIVTFFSFLSGSMASATQRFFSFALGQNNFEKLKTTFTINWLIYGAIALIAVILLETVGCWFVSKHLNIPLGRYEAVVCVYHFAVFSFVTSIMTSPFTAMITAHEDMRIFAYVSIIEAIMKLSVVFLLQYLAGDKLEVYGILLFAVSLINAIIYIAICMRKYQECQFRQFYWDNRLLREIVGFTTWTLFGQVTSVARNQGITILINQFFNPVVVAAKAIASSITNQINLFSNNFNIGLYPPIIKSYAAGNKMEMFSLIFRGSKITFFLMWVFALPLFLEMDTILQVWLKNPPPGTILFTRLALIEVLITSISLPITTAARAPGKMKFYEFTLGCIQIAIFIVSWFVLVLGAAAYSVFIVAIVANLLMFLVRLLIVKQLIDIPLRNYYVRVVLPVSIIIFLSGVSSFAIHWLLPVGFVYACISILMSILISSVSMYFVGLNILEREKIRNVVMSRVTLKKK
ncbi:hypothetical protein FACS189413_03090 [Bacteroidia bacterium]|nr:hypothetical protein FACS189413_03090 [Bacteroidia bacterium]